MNHGQMSEHNKVLGGWCASRESMEVLLLALSHCTSLMHLFHLAVSELYPL